MPVTSSDMGEVIEFRRRAAGPQDTEARFTIKDVAHACGLPQPVIAQVVSRTWTAAGWMYTAAQMQEAVDYADNRRMERDSPGGASGDRAGQTSVHPEPMAVADRMAAARSLHPSADRTNRGPGEE